MLTAVYSLCVKRDMDCLTPYSTSHKTYFLSASFLSSKVSGSFVLYGIYLCNDSYSTLLICRLSLSTGGPRTKPYNVATVFKSLQRLVCLQNKCFACWILFILFSGLYGIYLCNDSYSSLLICRLSLSTGCPRTHHSRTGSSSCIRNGQNSPPQIGNRRGFLPPIFYGIQ